MNYRSYVDHIIMTSDERDEVWWDLVKTQSWCRLEHSNTSAAYGRWFVLPIFSVPQTSSATVCYPVIIDAVV